MNPEWGINRWEKIGGDIIKKSFECCGYGNNNNIEPQWKKYYIIK